MGKSTISDSIKQLIDLNLIKRGKRGIHGYSYSIAYSENADFSKEIEESVSPVTEQDSPSTEPQSPDTEQRGSVTGHTKETIKRNYNKKTNQKKLYEYINENLEIPDYLKDSIDDWIEHKEQIKNPATGLSLKKLINMLSKYEKSEQIEMINHSIISGYKGVFPPRNSNGQETRKDVKLNNDREIDVLEDDAITELEPDF
jgi:hypothetical protein